MECVFVDGNTKFVGFYQTIGPTGYIEASRRDDVIRFAAKLTRSWPNTIAKKPYRDNKGNWVIKVKAK